MVKDWIGPEPAQILSTAKDLAQARQTGQSLNQFPSPPPPDLVTAYRVQETLIGLLEQNIAGWCTQPINRTFRQALRSERIAGPILDGRIIRQDPADSAPIAMAIPANWRASLTVELIFEIGQSASAQEFDWNLESAKGLIGAVHWCAVIFAGPYASTHNFGPAYVAADLGCVEQVLIGPAIENWQACDFGSLIAQVDGNPFGVLVDEPDAPFDAMVYAAVHCAARSRPLMQGQWVSTGSIQPPLNIKVGERVAIGFGDNGLAEINIVAR